MSRELWKEKGELPSGTSFFGGKDRGMCIQLTHLEDTQEGHVHSYITFSVDVIEELIKKLKSIEKKVK